MTRDVGAIVVGLGHPNRLPILIALEQQSRTVSELAKDLGLTRDTVKHAIKQLAGAELVHVVAKRRAGGFEGLVYATPLIGWTKILTAIETVAATG